MTPYSPWSLSKGALKRGLRRSRGRTERATRIAGSVSQRLRMSPNELPRPVAGLSIASFGPRCPDAALDHYTALSASWSHLRGHVPHEGRHLLADGVRVRADEREHRHRDADLRVGAQLFDRPLGVPGPDAVGPQRHRYALRVAAVLAGGVLDPGEALRHHLRRGEGVPGVAVPGGAAKGAGRPAAAPYRRGGGVGRERGGGGRPPRRVG